MDIGCGNGGLLATFKKAGYVKLAGIEPSSKNVEFIKNEYEIEVYEGFLGDGTENIINRVFDIVILEGVLEHIQNLRESIKQCCKYMTTNGFFVIVVPDLAQFGKNVDLFQQFSVEHINFFSERSLGQLLNGEGLFIKKVEKGNGYLMVLCSREEPNLVVPDKCKTDEIYLKNYIENNKEYVKRLTDKINAIKAKDIYIWGCGTYTAMLFQLGLLDRFKIRAVIDSNKNFEHKKIYGVEIFHPQSIAFKKYPIFISSQIAGEEIYGYIKNTLKLSNFCIKLYE